MSTSHIGSKGPAPCSAKKVENCPFYRGENETNHYDTPQEAQIAYEKKLERENGLGTIRSSRPTPAMMPPKKRPLPNHRKPDNRVDNKKTVLTGKFKKGQVSYTTGQVKKHVSQMTDKEKQHIHDTLGKIKSFTYSGHVKNKVAHDGLLFKESQIQSVLSNREDCNIIEYNKTFLHSGEISNRILVRSRTSYPVTVDGKTQDCNICFVIDVDRNDVRTVYWNNAKDNHTNMNPSRYTKGLSLGF